MSESSKPISVDKPLGGGLGGPPPDGGARARAASWLGWGLVAGLGAVVLHVGWLSLPWPLIHDAPIMHYVAWRIGEGAVPYRDLFDMNFPGVYLMHLAVLRLLGSGDAAWRAFDLAWLGLASLLVGALAAPWGRVAATGGALFFAAYHLGAGAWQAGQRDFLLCPFLLAAALGVVRFRERRDVVGLVVGGLALGAGMTIKPHASLYAVALALGVLLPAGRPGGARWKATAAFAASISVVPFGVVAWLGAIGALGAWREIVVDYLIPLYSRLKGSDAWAVDRWSLWPVIVVALVLSLAHLWITRRFTFRHAVVTAGLGYGLLHYLGQGKGWEYHLYPLAAFAAVLLFSEVEAVLRLPRLRVGAPLLAGLVMIVLMLGVTGARTAEATWIWDKERVVRLLTWDLQQRVSPGDTVQVLDTTDGGVHALLRLRLTEPTRFLYDFHFFHDPDQPAIRALRAEFMRALDRDPPRYIVVFRSGWPAGGYERIERFPELARWLTTRYVIDERRPTYVIHAKRDRS